MDTLDSKIIAELQKNLRQSNRRLAQSLNVDEHTIRKRIENLVSSGTVILAALPNLKRLGYQTRIFMLLEAAAVKFDDVGKQLCQIPQLGFVAYCAGFTKFYVRGDFTTIESVAKFVKDDLGKIHGINCIDIIIELEQLKSMSTELTRKANSQLAGIELSQQESVSIDKVDRHLIFELQKNARASLKELAHVVGVSPMTIQRHIKYLVENGTIDFTAIPSAGTLGYPVIAFARIQTNPARTCYVAESCAKYPQIHYVGITAGSTQILITLHGHSHQIISGFVTSELSKIEGIVKVDSFGFLEMLKQNFTWITK
jgi:DNA-binding Lrp family transcriptional regulator